MSDANQATIGATLSITQTITVFTVLMPSISDVNRHTDEPNHPFTSDVRQSELVASTLSLSIGAIMARLEGSWTPFIMTSVLVAMLLFAYEYTLRKPGHGPNLVNMNRNQEGTGS